MILVLDEARESLREDSSQSDAEFLQRYFKTGPGEYGEGDTFIGVRIPVTRRVARKFRAMSLSNVVSRLQSPIHAERLRQDYLKSRI